MMRVSALLSRLRSSAVAWSFAWTALRTSAALVLLPLLVRVLSPAELGIWYALQSIAAASYLVDFGFTTTFSRFASYLSEGAETLRPEGLAGAGLRGTPNWAGLATLRATAARLYVGIVAGAVLLFLAIAFVVVVPEAAKLERPLPAYCATGILIAASAMTIVASRYTALLSGIGGLVQAMRIGSLSQVVQIVVSVVVLAAGWGLPGVSCALLLSAALTALWTRTELSRRVPRGCRGRYSSTYLRAMLPNTARLGGVFVGSYLITQANTLVTLRSFGGAATGSYGLSLQAVNFAAAICFIFVNTKTPLFAQLHQRGALPLLRSTFITGVRRSLVAYALVAVMAIVLGPWVLRRIGARTGLLPVAQLSVLFLVRFLEAHHTSHGTLVVTGNRVPFVVPALLSGGAILILSAITAPRYGMWAVVLVPGLVQAAWNNWWTVLLGLRGLSMSLGGYLRALLEGDIAAEGGNAGTAQNGTTG